ncbi:recombinase family protein [Haliangium sp. UPWRP_2]|uniref:recombinase family protein n=1 Tax=Haliangium sp. UPWRP_2 TaxID=1931276 RepID=UPI000B53D351|nr:recombinase family protein [Haliangium sp. UPWRP_2]PSM31878.1 hypothetical protein BVG81_003195 [Haliangium sp. UPWRP_2]
MITASKDTVPNRSTESPSGTTRKTAVGYVRVSTSMQAEDGLSLDAQKAAITAYCNTHDLRLLRIYADVESGAKTDRRGLDEALAARADVFVVLKFDRLSRSIKHFCQLYEDYFSQSVELVAIREAIKLDSALGRALVSILLVFAQMEREAIGERTREAIGHIRRGGYHFGWVPYGKAAVPAPDNPRYRILAENKEELKCLERIKSLLEDGHGPRRIAEILNEEKVPTPRGEKWTKSMVYHLRCRTGWHDPKPLNQRPHSDEEVKARMSELRSKGHTYQAIANILNEEGYKPLCGEKFTKRSVPKLLGGMKVREVLTPRTFAEQYIARCTEKPSLGNIGSMLQKSGYQTPRGNAHWWPAQVRELLAGHFDEHYASRPKSSVGASAP